MRGFEAIPELIRRSDLPVVFGMVGGTNVQWIAHGVQTDAFRFVRTRHEATSVSAAAGFSRATGKVGLASVTRGPGFANAVNALKAATHDHVPVVLIVAESPPSKVRISANYQSIDQAALTATIGAGFHHVGRPEEFEERYWAALRATCWNGCPQVLSIADGIVDSQVPIGDETPSVLRLAEPPDPEAVMAAVDALERAERPLILAGQGAVLADCRSELEHLADLVGARVASTLNVNRYFSGYPNDLGVCGESSPPMVLEELAKTDVVLAVGASLNNYTTGQGHIFAGSTVIQCEIDVDQPFRATASELGLLGDAKVMVGALTDEWCRRGMAKRSVHGSTPTFDEIGRSILDVDLGHDCSRGLDVRRVYATLSSKLPAERIIVTDSGRYMATMASLVDARDARSWLVSRGYGSIGLGLGAAIGAAVGVPERPVVLFCGDGGFMMSAQDLDAVRLNDLNLTVVIMNDEQYGSELQHLAMYNLPGDVVRQDLPDVVSLAHAFGGVGVVVQTEDELAALGLPYRGLFIVDVRLDPAVNGRAVF